MKLVPGQGAYEIRVEGPMVTPGYFEAGRLPAVAFDEAGFYRTGDAVGAGRPGRPERRAGVPGPDRGGLQA